MAQYPIPEMIKIDSIFVRWDAIKFVFDTVDETGKVHACFYAGGKIIHKSYEMTSQQIFDLIENTKKGL